MGKYSDEIVTAYVNGDFIEGFSIDELENDLEFMLKVFDLTKDKKMYNLCSESIKTNKEFVRYIVMSFSDDIEFITKVVKNYFDYLEMYGTNVTFERISMAKLMADITCGKYEKEYNEYCALLNSTYSCCRTKVDLEKKSADYK